MEKEAALLPPSMRSRLALPRPVFCHTRHASSGVFLFPCFTKEIGVWPRPGLDRGCQAHLCSLNICICMKSRTQPRSRFRRASGRFDSQAANRSLLRSSAPDQPFGRWALYNASAGYIPLLLRQGQRVGTAMLRNAAQLSQGPGCSGRLSVVSAARAPLCATRWKERHAPHDRQRRQRGARLPALLRARRMD